MTTTMPAERKTTCPCTQSPTAKRRQSRPTYRGQAVVCPIDNRHAHLKHKYKRDKSNTERMSANCVMCQKGMSQHGVEKWYGGGNIGDGSPSFWVRFSSEMLTLSPDPPEQQLLQHKTRLIPHNHQISSIALGCGHLFPHRPVTTPTTPSHRRRSHNLPRYTSTSLTDSRH